jgi:hypothetical protein
MTIELISIHDCSKNDTRYSLNVGGKCQAGEASISSVTTTIYANVVPVRDAFLDGPLDRRGKVMLHVPDSPLPVPLVKERLSVARTATEIHLQCRITPVGKPLRPRIEPPIIPRPRGLRAPE